jgi:plastocyanin
MDTRKANLLTPLILGIAAISATGCELIASVDRSEISTGTSSSSAGGGGGMGGMSSTSSMSSGSGGSSGCTAATDCPDPMNECVTATCTAGMCGTENVAADTPTTTQTMANCKLDVCDGMGAIISVDDNADIEDDNNSCTDDVCNAGTPEHAQLPAGTMCTDSGGTVCSTAGVCVPCNLGTDCAGGICVNNQCVQINGCDATNTVVMTGVPSVTVDFGGMTGTAYSPACLRVSMGTVVTFNGNFSFHPLQGGEVINMVGTPASSGPFATLTSNGMSANFTMSSTGTFPYYCTMHVASGMMGTVFVQ